MNRQIRWGILGYARIARLQLIPAILASGNGRIQALASRDESKLAEACAQVPELVSYTSYSELLADPQVDAVYIPLPNALHRQWVVAALDAGKHVLCEKPLALSAREAREMQAAAVSNERLLMEAIMYRYTDRTRQLRAVLDSGVLGEIRHVNASFRFLLDRPGTIKMEPELGGGALYDVGVYPVSLLGLITDGALPVRVHAEAQFDNGVDVNASVLLRYESGLLATLHCGFNAFGQMGAEIIGSKGRLMVPDPFLGEAGELTLVTAQGSRSIPVSATDRYTAQVRDFAAAVLQQRSPLIPLKESIRNLEVLDLIRASLQAH
ncbi:MULTISPECIES: Gfo/Idh/MocA family protein [Uliginosibacterium]|uniref:Gfo/Idh/MocA family oxidoreductase n=1 Tax=Uliginosibacterium aquaticum TaxID=2731212 RepID=A0ABX2IG33_9RHOO|nr:MULTISPECIES: Gfo/Idh/MocA family oxidoreductase [Uliginosibacterium]MDO6385094.1 Gfo/Idh/MocA family oxidoreductase [Uliginosibacterium sp. 31-12]NSL55192.1 Gfo/Idh/MocA family oxidoreductase [Uliginosibacterium aquaticum]PLK48770.1 gfo/Idh/MocA family oxidoreductase [Uliginosibacterium sp. TH139]